MVSSFGAADEITLRSGTVSACFCDADFLYPLASLFCGRTNPVFGCTLHQPITPWSIGSKAIKSFPQAKNGISPFCMALSIAAGDMPYSSATSNRLASRVGLYCCGNRAGSKSPESPKIPDTRSTSKKYLLSAFAFCVEGRCLRGTQYDGIIPSFANLTIVPRDRWVIFSKALAPSSFCIPFIDSSMEFLNSRPTAARIEPAPPMIT